MIPLLLAIALGASGSAAATHTPDLHVARPHGGDTHCAACHTADGWKEVRFAHERTGFPLEGRHTQVACKICHSSGFGTPINGACAACHRDAHGGELGGRCASCHDATSWRTGFTADAHRRTNFPLSGRHAFIPCEECHGDRRDRRFSRATVDCYACHQADFARAEAVLPGHAGFGTACRQCHSPWRFANAFFPAHDHCFLISSGPHARIPCLNCHTTLVGAAVTGACATGTADCMRCHACATVTPLHQGVLGFQCADQKCYECHRFVSSGAGLRLSPLRSR